MTVQQHKPPGPAGTNTSPPSGSPAATDAMLGLPSTARILPFALYIAFIAIADGLDRLGWSGDALRWLYSVKILAVVAVLLAYRRQYTELRWKSMSPGTVFQSVLVGIVVLILWVTLSAPWMQIGASAGFDPRSASGEIDWLLVVCRIAGAALVVPVMEELFWRSFLMRWLASSDFRAVPPARVGMRALAVTVVLFGFEHNLWLAGIVAGIAYSLLYMRSGNLWSPILAHAVTNGLLGIWVVVTGSWTYW